MVDRVRVKICGLMRREDVEVADAAGADYVGVILSAGFARSVDPARAGELVRGVSATPVAVIVDEDPDGARMRAATIGAGVIQLHGDEPPEMVEELAGSGEWRLWKSIRVREPEDVTRAVARYGALVHGLLFEGFREGVVEAEGSGWTSTWSPGYAPGSLGTSTWSWRAGSGRVPWGMRWHAFGPPW